jgi:hypothetical protein
MAAGWPATAVVLLACAWPLLLWPAGARADGDAPLRHQHRQQQQHWCMIKECQCIAGAELIDKDGERQQQVTVKCTFSGEQVRHVFSTGRDVVFENIYARTGRGADRNYFAYTKSSPDEWPFGAVCVNIFLYADTCVDANT